MTRIDVRDLVNEKLPAGKFPVDPRADFRLYIAPDVRRGIEQHAKADVTVEICGVLVGNWGVDENGPYAAVTNYIRCENASSKFAEVTFTHDSWAQINKEMDSKYADARIIGWYHSHPDFGIFLSERDAFIQEHFFGGAGQVAYVIDPVRNLEGVFAWHDGKPKPMPHFWIGDQVRTVEASERNVSGEMTKNSTASGAGGVQGSGQASRDASPMGLATMALGALCLLLLGYLYGGWRAHAAEELNRQEAVARMADVELIREQVDLRMAEVGKQLVSISDLVAKWPEIEGKPSQEQMEDIAARRKVIRQHVMKSARELENLDTLSDAERGIYTRIIGMKLAELYRISRAIQEQEEKLRAERQATQARKPAKGSSATPPKDKTSSNTSTNAMPKDQPQPPAPHSPPAQSPTR